MTPLYVMVVLWGERYRRYFTDYGLPSLLAPKNLPALTGTGHRLVLVCPNEDWEAMREHPNLQRLRQTNMEPLHLAFRPKTTITPCKAMGDGHRLATHAAYLAGAYGMPITPDLAISDGLIESVLKKAQAGASVVLACALRFSEEALLPKLDANPWPSARELAGMALDAVHTETRSYEWGRRGFHPSPSAIWVPADGGMVCCTMSWAPVLLDYRVLPAHTTQTLDRWTMDGDYVYRNWGDGASVQTIRDTDEGCLVSWTPNSPCDDQPVPAQDRLDAKSFGRWFNHRVFDPLKRQRFWEPVLWHRDELHAGFLVQAQALLDELGALLNYDWKRKCFLNAQREPVGTLAESLDAYEARARLRT